MFANDREMTTCPFGDGLVREHHHLEELLSDQQRSGSRRGEDLQGEDAEVSEQRERVLCEGRRAFVVKKRKI